MDCFSVYFYSVRSRAIAAFSQCFTTTDSGIKTTLKEMVTPVVGPRPAHIQHLIPTPEMEGRAQPVVESKKNCLL